MTEKPIRFKLPASVTSAYTIQPLFGRHLILKRADDGLYDSVDGFSSIRKAEAALVKLVTAG